MIFNSSASYSYPSFGNSDMASIVGITSPSLINSDLMFAADVAMSGSVLTLDDKLEGLYSY